MGKQKRPHLRVLQLYHLDTDAKALDLQQKGGCCRRGWTVRGGRRQARKRTTPTLQWEKQRLQMSDRALMMAAVFFCCQRQQVVTQIFNAHGKRLMDIFSLGPRDNTQAGTQGCVPFQRFSLCWLYNSVKAIHSQKNAYEEFWIVVFSQPGGSDPWAMWQAAAGRQRTWSAMRSPRHTMQTQWEVLLLS